MDHDQKRRYFLKQCATFGGACCALLASSRLLFSQESTDKKAADGAQAIDFGKLSYCGIPCVQVCELYKATVENDVNLKKKMYEEQEWKKNFGLEFDPDKVFCYTCKPGDKPKKPGMESCLVRVCVLANGMESCVQCQDLNSCGKEFWKTWKELYAFNQKNQARYLAQAGAKLIEPRAKK